eukprot:11325693-Karenia_brevis.AAC.1
MERVSPPRRINLLASFNQTSTISKNRAKVEEFVADFKDRAEKDQKEDASKSKDLLDVLTANTSSSSEEETLYEQEVFNSFVPHIIDSCQRCPECQEEVHMELHPLFSES